ncbi:MAG: HEAT repeat domain-containing protein [Planctomycetota bacterium]|nr:MAG: HEAT repeat domain-containing protein [Planctomycetota bacterium]
MVQRKVGRYLLVLVVLIVLVASALVAADQIRLRQWKNGIRSPDADVRDKSLYRVAREREYRAVDVVLAALQDEQDRDVLDQAGYAAMRLRDQRGIELLVQRAGDRPDDIVRASLIYYAARLSRPFDLGLLEWLKARVESAESWQRAGSIVGLLELGQPRGGELLIQYAGEAEAEVRGFMLREFRRIAGPMAEAVGQNIDWPVDDVGSQDKQQWASLQAFWQNYGTETLLNDVLRRLEIKDPRWYEVNRLLHARDRVDNWLK